MCCFDKQRTTNGVSSLRHAIQFNRFFANTDGWKQWATGARETCRGTRRAQQPWANRNQLIKHRSRKNNDQLPNIWRVSNVTLAHQRRAGSFWQRTSSSVVHVWASRACTSNAATAAAAFMELRACDNDVATLRTGAFRQNAPSKSAQASSLSKPRNANFRSCYYGN